MGSALKISEMKSVSSTEYQQNVGHFMQEAMVAPLLVKRYGRPGQVVMSVQAFEAFLHGRSVAHASELDPDHMRLISEFEPYDENAELDQLLEE